MTTISPTSPVTITPNVLAETLTQGLMTDQASMASLEQQISTGNAINVPSDNPAGAAQVLQLQANLQRANQYASNAQDATGWLTLANSTVSTVLNQLQSVLSLVNGVSGTALTGQSTTLQSTADQVQATLQDLVNLANTTYEGGQPLFAGTGSASQAYTSTGSYQGGGSAPTRTVAPGTQIAVSVTGPEIFGSGASGLLEQSTTTGGVTVGTNGVLAQIVSDLQSGNVSSVTGSDLTALHGAITQVENAAGTLGALQQQVEGFSQQATSSATTLQQEIGSVQGTNMAESITNLQLQQTAYQEALYATAQLSNDSLAKYL